ncbi:lytic transglycosylase domain-containing protein [Tessaracoccus palaemonis]|uniref:Lytic transglycosylase domain-containing protein n=1 Tax=Tessaracoccus palaemonis TaxID=2829499 RepID=A0ABX8SMJ7_9ACTN|nr:lytic transglycosylase domain-containing protein [Tessaracoccus palaemonis]QXT63600.1 lytic transglycosylase domain-containing protein [Tessaracoccus palaemonis]
MTRRRTRSALCVVVVCLAGCQGPEPAPTAQPPGPTASPTAQGTWRASEPGSAAAAPVGVSTRADAAWVASTAVATGIPARAMAAYAGATLEVQAQYPACGLDWATLAGIGWVESHHGTYQGGAIGDDGAQTPPLIGIALDGTSTLTVRDTDEGRLDADTVWDRAVGPMQFIPSTWADHGSDGNGDGVADPQNIDDAALSAGRYLCAGGVDLTNPSDWMGAVASYNPSVSYNNLVAAATDGYRVSAAS